MSVTCDVIIKWGATPEQLTTLGSALWRWCNHTAGPVGIYHFLDNQMLTDLMAGTLPLGDQFPWESDLRGIHFRARDHTSPNCRAALATLRRVLPTEGIEDVRVDGVSWKTIDAEARTVPTVPQGRGLQLLQH